MRKKNNKFLHKIIEPSLITAFFSSESPFILKKLSFGLDSCQLTSLLYKIIYEKEKQQILTQNNRTIFNYGIYGHVETIKRLIVLLLQGALCFTPCNCFLNKERSSQKGKHTF